MASISCFTRAWEQKKEKKEERKKKYICLDGVDSV